MVGIAEGQQRRMQRREAESPVQDRAERIGATLLLGAVVAGAVATALLPSVPLPGYQPGDSLVNVSLSTPLIEQCLGQACALFGGTVFGMFSLFIVFYVVSRTWPVLGFCFTVTTFLVIVPFALATSRLETLFEYVKLVSVYAGALFVATLRIDNILRQNKNEGVGFYEEGVSSPWLSFGRFLGNKVFPSNALLDSNAFCWLLFAALAINILEASAADLSLGNYANAIAGFWLVVAMPRMYMHRFDHKLRFFVNVQPSWDHVLFVDNSHVAFYDMVYATDWFWVFMYCSWNAAFAYDERREHFVIIVIVLVAALFPCAPRTLFKLDPHLFVQARTLTLLCRYIVLTIFDVYEEYADSSYWFNETINEAWGFANVGLIVLFMVYKFATFKGDSAGKVGDSDAAVPAADV